MKTIDLLTENFDGLGAGIDRPAGWDLIGGEIRTNDGNEGRMTLDTVDATGLESPKLTFDARTDLLSGESFEGRGSTGADVLRVLLLDADGNLVATLDVFHGDGDQMTSGKTGNSITSDGVTLEYDLPEGLTEFKIAFASNLSSQNELIYLDNVSITAQDVTDVVVDSSTEAGDDTIDGRDSGNSLSAGGSGVLGDTLGDGPGSTGGGYDRVYAQSVYNGNHTFSTDAFYLGNDIPVLDDANRNAITGVSFSQDGEGTDRTFGLDELTFTGAQRSFVGLVTVQDSDVHRANDQFSSSISGGFQDTTVVSSGTADFTMNDGQVFQGIRVNFVRGPDGETYMMPDDGPSPYAFNAFRNMLATNDSGIKSFTIATGSGDDAGINPIEGNWADGQFFELNAAPDAADDLASTLESESVFLDLLADNGNGVDSDPDGDALTITEAGGNALVGGFAVFAATSAGGRTGEVLVTGTGALNFAFDPNGGFDDLNAGETDTVTLSYTISDGNGLTDTADVTVTINGEDDNATVSGSISTTGQGDRHVAVILDTSIAAVATAAAIAVDDFDGDGNVGTVADLMLGKVSDLALTLEATDLLTIIPSGFSGIPDAGASFTLSAGVVQTAIATDAANGNIAIQQALFAPVAATYDPFDFTIDFEQAFNIANSRFDATSGIEQNKVIALVASEATFLGQGGEVGFFGDVEGAFDDVTDAATDADVDILVIPSNAFVNAANLSAIDSDGTVDVDTTQTIGLATLLDPAPTVASDADVVSFEVSIDGVVDAGIDLSDLTPVADGFEFAPTELGAGVFDATIGLDLNGDGTADLTRSLSDTVVEADRTLAQGDAFDFDLDGFFANPLSAGG